MSECQPILRTSDFSVLRQSATPLVYHTEIIVLFPHARNNCTNFESILYDAFIRFGSGTDDVMVRILHPTFISNEYHELKSKYGIVQLPCAIFIHKATERVVVTMERDSFETISDLDADKLDELISDIHQAISENRLTMAKMLAPGFWIRIFPFFSIFKKNRKLSVKCEQTSNGERFFSINNLQNLVMINKTGDVIVGDQVGGSKSG